MDPCLFDLLVQSGVHGEGGKEGKGLHWFLKGLCKGDVGYTENSGVRMRP